MKTKAYIHSLKKGETNFMAVVNIVEHKGNNHVIAEYRGNLYTAVYNPFVGAFYVDDIYGYIGKADSNGEQRK